MMRQKLFFLPDGGRAALNHLHVDNLVEAILLAAQKDVAGDVFNVTDGATTTCADYFSRLARAIGLERLPTMPAWMLRAMIGLIAGGHRAMGREPPATADAIAFLRRPHHYSIARARDRLGYEPRITLEQGMAEVERWLQTPEGQALTASR
jgi:nucleoside-diphosphate-sugar epimerase